MTVSGTLKGGCGNILFICSTILAYSLKHKCDYFIPTTIENPHYKGQKVFYSKYLTYSDSIPSGVKKIYVEPYYHFEEIPYVECDFLELSGYFQSFLYFNDYREEILEILDIPYEFKKGKIFLHYRLGDYKNLPNCHPIIKNDYIEKSIAYFVNEGFKDFIVFSDEIDEAEMIINSEKYPEAQFEYSEGRTEVEDLSLMSSCEGGILSASSFSWWGAWLGQNENRKIIYPSRWFGEALSYHNLKDLCLPTWQAI